MAEQQQFHLLLGNLMSPDNGIRKQSEVSLCRRDVLGARKRGVLFGGLLPLAGRWRPVSAQPTCEAKPMADPGLRDRAGVPRERAPRRRLLAASWPWAAANDRPILLFFKNSSAPKLTLAFQCAVANMLAPPGYPANRWM